MEGEKWRSSHSSVRTFASSIVHGVPGAWLIDFIRCIYFLDPEDIVPPSTPVPLVPRPRTNSFPQPEPEPVILEPPVTTNPVLCRPTLPQTQTNIIRRLSARVNVLPVVARADTLTNDRLAALRLAVRRDLAEAGIGFGIFDTDNHPHSADSSGSSVNGDMTNGYANHANGSTSSPRGTSPTSPTSPSFLRLPYALISPDIYSHSDGVPRVLLPRHEIIHQYTPSNHHAPSSKLVRGKFVRNYRWGPLDVLDPTHSDFMALRAAIFHHMETLQKYTREYLFDKFRAEYLSQHHQRLPVSHHSLHHISQSIVSRPQLPPPPSTSRPVLAIDTAPSHSAPNRLPPLSVSREVAIGREIHSVPPVRGPHPDAMSTSTSARVSPSAPSQSLFLQLTLSASAC
jgi:Septin